MVTLSSGRLCSWAPGSHLDPMYNPRLPLGAIVRRGHRRPHGMAHLEGGHPGASHHGRSAWHSPTTLPLRGAPSLGFLFVIILHLPTGGRSTSPQPEPAMVAGPAAARWTRFGLLLVLRAVSQLSPLHLEGIKLGGCTLVSSPLLAGPLESAVGLHWWADVQALAAPAMERHVATWLGREDLRGKHGCYSSGLSACGLNGHHQRLFTLRVLAGELRSWLTAGCPKPLVWGARHVAVQPAQKGGVTFADGEPWSSHLPSMPPRIQFPNRRMPC